MVPDFVWSECVGLQVKSSCLDALREPSSDLSAIFVVVPIVLMVSERTDDRKRFRRGVVFCGKRR